MSGVVSDSLTVWSSTTVIAPSRACLEVSSTSVPMRAAIELPSTVASHQRVKLLATSAAVKSSPFDHFTPLRTCSVYSVALSLTSQLSRSMPRKVPSALYSTRYSSQPRPKSAIWDQSQVRGSLSALVSICMRSVPPGWPCSCARAGALRPSRP